MLATSVAPYHLQDQIETLFLVYVCNPHVSCRSITHRHLKSSPQIPEAKFLFKISMSLNLSHEHSYFSAWVLVDSASVATQICNSAC